MRIAYFDCFAGISGDMTVGAFLNAGMPIEHLREEIAKVNLEEVTLQSSIRMQSRIAATKFDVRERNEQHEHGAHDHHHGRSYAEIVRLIEASGLSDTVKRISIEIFQTIGAAEAKLHAMPIEEIHFHEVGAADSIVDIVGTAISLAFFDIEEVYSSTVRMGSGGMIETQHGPMPVPAPATLEILKDYPVSFTNIPFELTTPTGAAIIKALSRGARAQEEFSPEAIGYGAGTRDLPGIPNMLRVVIAAAPARHHDEPLLLETNIDDMSPDVYPYVIERLFEAGALDAYLTPVIMKKGRPAFMLSALIPPAARDAILETIYAETPTLGVRVRTVSRVTLPRTSAEAHTSFGNVRVKEIRTGHGVRRVPEYDECARLARERRVSLRSIREQLLLELNRSF